MDVLIKGEGVAAYCAAHLLRTAGLGVAHESAGRPRIPALLLGETAQKLMQDAFGREDLFAGLPRIRRRMVLWGQNAEPFDMPHAAIVISEVELLARVRPASLPSPSEAQSHPGWTIWTGREIPPAADRQAFGSRTAGAAKIRLAWTAESEACWAESLANGWLFLIATAPTGGWLLSVGAPANQLLPQSRLIAGRIHEIESEHGSFPSHPGITFPLCDAQWLACGSAALAFDPICGDGTGNAIREAILASAVIRAAQAGAETGALLDHYRSRLLAGFERHLETCRAFYDTGLGPWWNQELAAIRRGLSWCAGRREPGAPPRFRLNGFQLEPLSEFVR